MRLQPEIYDSLNISIPSSPWTVGINLKMGPIEVSKYSEHLLVKRLDDILMEIRGKGRVTFSWEYFLVGDPIRYIRHDKIYRRLVSRKRHSLTYVLGRWKADLLLLIVDPHVIHSKCLEDITRVVTLVQQTCF